MYKIETHLHTVTVSKCAHLEPEVLIRGYREAGYDGIIVTDHYNRTTFEYLGISTTGPEDKAEAFLTGYRAMAELGEKAGIRVFKGAEIRFDESENDYLIYGFADDLLREPEELFRMGIAAFSSLARAEGVLVVQAHPYRKQCTPAIAQYLDGVEVRNMNPRHDSRNALAQEYAEQFGLLGLAGSDCHRTEDIGLSGICTQELPSDSMGMMRLIRSRRYTLL